MLGLLATVTPHLPATQVASGPSALSLLFGAVVGFSLGLTGGGGSIFAVPLLMYGLGMPSKEAMGVSLAAVGATALLGMLPRLRSGEVELTTGLLFAAAGMLGTPFGTYLRSVMPEPLLLGLFVAVMLVVAARMPSPSRSPPTTGAPPAAATPRAGSASPPAAYGCSPCSAWPPASSPGCSVSAAASSSSRPWSSLAGWASIAPWQPPCSSSR
jgi:uncharacterized membrane protein YfcA